MAHRASSLPRRLLHVFFFFNDTATTEIYTLSLHDALPIYYQQPRSRHDVVPHAAVGVVAVHHGHPRPARPAGDRKSTRLNSSHSQISYAVFCLKKKMSGCRTLGGATHPRPARQPPLPPYSS